MKIKRDPIAQLIRQISSLYPEETAADDRMIINGTGLADKELLSLDRAFPAAIERLEKCFSKLTNKYYLDEGETVFNPLHVCQWTMFLYMISNQLYLDGPENIDLCDKIYGLSKMFSSADIYYAVSLPEVFFFDHPQGSVIGRAEYGEYFAFDQGCTVGNNKGKYPVFGKHVSLKSDSKVIGDCHVGDHVIFAANSYIKDMDIPSYSIVFGMDRDVLIKPITEEKYQELSGYLFNG
ncbi:MAG: transferase [Lachnospiraceae bacterium]|nr:transferase [Lachnospiraceae bacterium]